MTVYVDDVRLPATVGRLKGVWSHMLVRPDGDLGELHVMAAGLGLRRSYFQGKGWPRAHYDLTEPLRARAVAAGAVEVSAMEAARWRADAIATVADDGAPACDPSWLPSRRLPALTVHQPWALALMTGAKPVENRGWRLGYRGLMWLHAGKGRDRSASSSPLVAGAWLRYAAGVPALAGHPDLLSSVPGPDSPLIAAGEVIALLDVAGCHHADECGDRGRRPLCSPWAVPGQYHVEVTVAAVLPAPLPCRGQEKLWALPAGVEQAARRQLRGLPGAARPR